MIRNIQDDLRAPFDEPIEPLGALEKSYAHRRCLITGHTGFKGSWLSLWLHRMGSQVAGYALAPPTCPSLFASAEISELVRDHRGDVRDLERLRTVVEVVRPEIVFHLAAQPILRRSYAEPKNTFDINVGGTVNLLEALRNCPTVRAVVVVTSDKCYENQGLRRAFREGDPLGGHDLYSASKAMVEIVCSSYQKSFFASAGVALSTARAGNAIGGGDWAEDRLIPDAVRALQAGQPVALRNPRSIRPWQHVLEPLFGYLMLGARLLETEGVTEGEQAGGSWNFGPDPDANRTVSDLMDEFIGAWGEGRWQDLSAEQTTAPHEAQHLALCWDKARTQLAWHPTWGFSEAIRKTAQWYRRWAEGASGRQLCLQQIREYVDTEKRTSTPLRRERFEMDIAEERNV